MNRIQIFLMLSILVLMHSCSFFEEEPDKNAVARVGDSYLYKKDLQGIVTPGSNKKDSIASVNNYIDNWIKEQAVLQKAEANLSQEKLDVEKKLENYRRSLIVYRYQTELIRQKLDTIVSDKQIKKYYENHQEEFELKKNIVKVLYVKVRLDAPNQKQLKTFLMSDDPEDRQKLKEFCKRYAVNYFLDDNSWLYFNDLLKEIPIETYNKENYLRNNRYVEVEDSLFRYYMRIKGFRIKESTSPLAFERDRIRDIIINQRKIDFIQEMKEGVVEEARRKNKIETFNE